MSNDFEQLVNDTINKIKEFGIKSCKAFKLSCQLLKVYLELNDLEFSIKNGEEWLSKVHPGEHMTETQRKTYSYRRRTVLMLAENKAGKLHIWRTYHQRTAVRPKTAEHLQYLKLYEQKLHDEKKANSTISLSMRVISGFLIYLEQSGIISMRDVLPGDIIKYFTQDKFVRRKPDGVKAYAYKLRSFLSFLEETGAVINKALSIAVPKVFAKQETIINVLSEKAEEMIKSGKAIPSSATAVRDHAMILLALRLGIRKSDIYKMKLSDIDWKNESISFVQQKTKITIKLPLLPDVGNALMDYILNFRPRVADKTVFIRHKAPYRALVVSPKVAERYLSVFDPVDCPERGFHILRRTFATGMMRNNIPRSTISASIGQIDPNSVDVYLSADEVRMQKCALPLKGIECARGDLQ